MVNKTRRIAKINPYFSDFILSILCFLSLIAFSMKQIPTISIKIDIIIAVIKRKRGNMENWVQGVVQEVENRTPHSHIKSNNDGIFGLKGISQLKAMGVNKEIKVIKPLIKGKIQLFFLSKWIEFSDLF